MIDEVFTALGLEVEIKLNNRKVLAGIAEVAGIGDKMVGMTVAIDKLDKIGWEGVGSELRRAEISEESIAKLQRLYESASLQVLKKSLDGSDEGRQGVKELEEVFDLLSTSEMTQQLAFDPTLARGLSYYTGCIFEVKSKEVNIGSILGGGRYADLTGVFGMPGMSGVGISFGVARIFDVLQELDRFPTSIDQPIKAMLIALDHECHRKAFKLLQELRKEGVAAHLYPEPAKLKKQMKYADATEVPYVILVGSEEIKKERYILKRMLSGEQWDLTIPEIAQRLKVL
jgi:histidyl-tRNA synthetase